MSNTIDLQKDLDPTTPMRVVKQYNFPVYFKEQHRLFRFESPSEFIELISDNYEKSFRRFSWGENYISSAWSKVLRDDPKIIQITAEEFIAFYDTTIVELLTTAMKL